MSKKLCFKNVTLTFLGHSGFILEKDGYKIVVDPFLKNAPLATKKPEEIEASVVFVTHGHADHIGDAVEIAQNNNCQICANFEVAQYCQEQGVKTLGVPVGCEQLFDWGKAIFRPALHSGILPNGKLFNLATGIIFDFGDFKIYHMGDTALNADIRFVGEIFKPDLALMPIGGRVNLSIEQALLATEWLGVEAVVPIHYDLYTQGEVSPLEFQQKLQQKLPLVKCFIMEP